jgi:hypothetical protein
MGIRKDALLPISRRSRAEEAREMKGKPGDRIVLEAEKAAQTSRSGVIEEVLQEEPPRLRVRWEDGRTSILAPAAGVAKIEQARK